MLKLTTYRRDQFPNLKAKFEVDGYTYASAMELCSAQKLASLCSEGPVALDVSPLLPLLNPTSRFNDIASVTEVLMHQLPDDTLFVADENATAGREYNMRTLFDEIEKSEIEGEPVEGAPTSSSRAAHSSRQCHAVPTAAHHATRTRGFNAAPMTGSLSGFPSCFQTPCRKEALDQRKGRDARAVCAGGGACNLYG